MTPNPDDPTSTIELHQPNAARIYDHLLGGSHSFAADRTAAEQLLQAAPGITAAARANRVFLARAVRYAIGHGVTQFLDLGAGIPATGSTHEIAHSLAPDARVVYVDRDPIAVACAERLLGGNPHLRAVHADLRDIRTVLADPASVAVLDLTQPVAVLMVAVLHFVPGNATRITGTLAALLPPDSLLIISHGTAEPAHYDGSAARTVTSIYAKTPTPLQLRSREQIIDLFTGFELTDPGLVTVDQWHPTAETTDPPIPGFLAGVGRLRRHPPPSTHGKPPEVPATAFASAPLVNLTQKRSCPVAGSPLVSVVRRHPFDPDNYWPSATCPDRTTSITASTKREMEARGLDIGTVRRRRPQTTADIEAKEQTYDPAGQLSTRPTGRPHRLVMATVTRPKAH